MGTSQTREDLIARAEELIFSLEHATIAPFRNRWPATGPALVLRQPVPNPLPVLQWLPQRADLPGGFGDALISTLCDTAPALHWRQTYTIEEAGAEFLQRYGYTALVGPDALLASSAVACGLLLLGPATLYPRHRHEAREIYVILSGNAEWLQGDDTWRRRAPGTLVHHASGEPHAMRTSDQPLLALYLWRSAALNQKAELG